MLWQPQECICPSCGQVHIRNAGSKSVGPQNKPLVDCRECVERKLDIEIETAKAEAHIAAHNLTGGTMKSRILHEAEMQVIREKLVGKTRLPDYWRAVRRKIEE